MFVGCIRSGEEGLGSMVGRLEGSSRVLGFC